MGNISTIFLDLKINNPHDRANIVINTLNADIRQKVSGSTFQRIDDIYAFIYVAEFKNTSPQQIKNIIKDSYALCEGEEIFMIYRYELGSFVFETIHGEDKD